MKKMNQYLKTAWYNILHNKGYAIFCFLDTTLTFIFIVLILQLELLLTLNKERTTIVMVTHDERIAQKTHRIIRLLDGLNSI
jgi:hypothetical protein